MPERREAETAQTALLRFALLTAPGFVVVTLFAWASATWGPRWVPNGEVFAQVCATFVVFFAAFRARLNALPVAGIAVALSVVLQLLIYYAPLLYLMDASYNRSLAQHLVGIAGQHAASYALAVGAALLLAAILNRKGKAE